MAGVAFAVEGDGVGFATESYAASALYTTLASLSGALWRIRRANPYPINMLKSEADLAVRIGMDVFILGYPFGNQPPGFPVWKRGSIATEPDLTRIGVGYLLVDTASRKGMSGAPVIRRSWGTHLLEGDAISADSTPQSKFIGVYSGRLHTKDQSDAQLGMVWPAEDIDDIIDGRKLDE